MKHPLPSSDLRYGEDQKDIPDKCLKWLKADEQGLFCYEKNTPPEIVAELRRINEEQKASEREVAPSPDAVPEYIRFV